MILNSKIIINLSLSTNWYSTISQSTKAKIEIDKSQNAVQYGDVFFTTSSETPEEVGISSVWLENTDNIYLNSFCFGYRPNEKIDPHYMAYMLRSEAVRKKIVFFIPFSINN